MNDLSITIQIRVSDYDAGIADCDDAAIGLVSEARKIARKMLAASERGAQERQFCSGAVRVAVTGGALVSARLSQGRLEALAERMGAPATRDEERAMAVELLALRAEVAALKTAAPPEAP